MNALSPKKPITAEHLAEAQAAIDQQRAAVREIEAWLPGAVAHAFELGLAHGKAGRTPWDANILLAILRKRRLLDLRILHRKKLRQVYGAGFDLGALHVRLGVGN